MHAFLVVIIHMEMCMFCDCCHTLLIGSHYLQGKISLVTHFQNSSLLHEDKRCRPILFNSNGEEAGEQEPFPVGPNMRVRSSKTGPHQGHRPEVHLNAPEMWQNTERGKELMSRGMRVDLNQ